MRSAKLRLKVIYLYYILALFLFLIITHLPCFANEEDLTPNNLSAAALPPYRDIQSNLHKIIPLVELSNSNPTFSNLQDITSFQKDRNMTRLPKETGKSNEISSLKEMPKIIDSIHRTSMHGEKHFLSEVNKQIEKGEYKTDKPRDLERVDLAVMNDRIHRGINLEKREEQDERKKWQKEAKTREHYYPKTKYEDVGTQPRQTEACEDFLFFANFNHVNIDPNKPVLANVSKNTLSETDEEKNSGVNTSELEILGEDNNKKDVNLVHSEKSNRAAFDNFSIQMEKSVKVIENFSVGLASQSMQAVDIVTRQVSLDRLDLVETVGKHRNDLQLNLSVLLNSDLKWPASKTNRSFLSKGVLSQSTKIGGFILNQDTKETNHTTLGHGIDNFTQFENVEWLNRRNLCVFCRNLTQKCSFPDSLSIDEKAVVEELQTGSKKLSVHGNFSESSSFIPRLNTPQTVCLFIGFYLLAGVLSVIKVCRLYMGKVVQHEEFVKFFFRNMAFSRKGFPSPLNTYAENALSDSVETPNNSVILSKKLEAGIQSQPDSIDCRKLPSAMMHFQQNLSNEPKSTLLQPVLPMQNVSQTRPSGHINLSKFSSSIPVQRALEGSPSNLGTAESRQRAQTCGSASAKYAEKTQSSKLRSPVLSLMMSTNLLSEDGLVPPEFEQSPKKSPEEHPIQASFFSNDPKNDNTLELHNRVLLRWV